MTTIAELKKKIDEIEAYGCNQKYNHLNGYWVCGEKGLYCIPCEEKLRCLKNKLHGMQEGKRQAIEEELEWLEFHFGKEKGYDVVKARISILKEELKEE